MKEAEGYIDLKRMLRLNNLLDAKFDEVFEGEELNSFKQFLAGSARDAGGFAVAFPTTDLQMVWVEYEINRELSNSGQIVIDLSPKVHLTSDVIKPEQLREVPVWWQIESLNSETKDPSIN